MLFVEAGNEIAFPLTFAHAHTVGRGTRNIFEVALFISLGVIKRTTTTYLSEIQVSRREIEARHEGSIGTKNMALIRRRINMPIKYPKSTTIIDVKFQGIGGTADERTGIRDLLPVLSPKSLYVQIRMVTETPTSHFRRVIILLAVWRVRQRADNLEHQHQ